MPNKDKKINRATWKRWREKNKVKDNLRIRKRKMELKNWFKEYRKTLKCSRCPENHPATIDFHHNKSDKLFDVAKMVDNGCSRERIMNEIKKCEVLCSNCHRKIHWG